MASSGLDAKIETLAAVLDGDIAHVQTVLKQLDQLRSLLIKRDDIGLQTLLTDLASEAEAHASHEQKRQKLRTELAGELRCSLEEATLSRLLRALSDPQRSEVAERQKVLRSLIGRLRREHMLTTTLLADCARFNQSLLRVFLGESGKGTSCYDASGTAVRRTGAQLMSLHF